MFGASKDCIVKADDHAIPIYNATASTCKDYIEIENNASHCAWAESADTCELGENLLCLFSTNFLDGGVQRSITTEVTTLWLEGQLKGNAAALAAYHDLLGDLIGNGTVTAIRGCP
jgi:hypothetical protein